MKKTDKTIEKTKALIVITILVLCSGMFAETAIDWGSAPSSVGGGVIITPMSTAVTVGFAETATDKSMPIICDLLVGGSSPASSFIGDLSEYTGIRFKITGDGFQPSAAELVIHQQVGSNSREWIYPGVAISTAPGEWMINLIPLSLDAGWNTGFDFTYVRNNLFNFTHIGATSEESAWLTDLADVQMMILRLAPSGLESQSYSVDQFQLIGADGTPTVAAQLTSLQAYFGVNSIEDLTDEQRAQDSDGDGMSDFNEMLAGMDPNDATSVFAAKTSKSAGGNVIEWKGVLGTSYAILSSADLSEDFTLIAGSQRTATCTGEVLSYEDTVQVDGSKFYKIVKY